ncbi:MAG: alpha/beta fold hydrolase [Spirochaetales bacterium]
MISGYSAVSALGVPYVVVGEGLPTKLVIPGIEPEHALPDGLRLQGVRGAFEELAEDGSVCIAWRREIKQRDVSFEEICDAYEDLVKELELADVTVVGVSTGSLFAIELSARLGLRCAGLALIAGGAELSDHGKRLMERSVQLAEEAEWRKLAYLQTEAYYPGLGGRLLAGIAWLLPGLYGTPEDPTHFTALCRLVARVSLYDRISEISAPLVSITGRADLIFPPEVSQRTALLSANGEGIIVPGAGHGIFKSKSSFITDEIKRFIRSRSPSS